MSAALKSKPQPQAAPSAPAAGLKIGFARVSTPDQDLAMQIDALKAAGCDRIFTETGSGAKADRPYLNAALSHLRPGDTLVVWRLDRLGRDLKHLVELVDDFKKRGIGLRSLMDPIDTTTAAGELVFMIFASLARFERELIKERTRAGVAAARARGRHGGRKKKLTTKEMREIRALMKDPEITRTEIAQRFKIGRSTLYEYINREGGPAPQETV
jgi:DNA invertase Pin-like site-specific DNA recombinase